jgi:hypothetical protein
MSLRRLLGTTLTQVGTAAGTLIALLTWDTSTTFRIAIAVVVIGLATLAVGLEIADFRTERAKGYKTPSRINRFMHRWISERGHVAIFFPRHELGKRRLPYTLVRAPFAKAHANPPTVDP